MIKQFKLTQESLDRLTEELHYLKTVREREVAEQIKIARSFGDLSENCEYDEAKNEQGKVFSRIAELENIVSHAVVINTTDIATDRVSAGCRVKVLEIDEDFEDEYWLVGSQEANPAEMRISDESPFGLALLGRREGDEFTLEAPAGTIRYRVLEIGK